MKRLNSHPKTPYSLGQFPKFLSIFYALALHCNCEVGGTAWAISGSRASPVLMIQSSESTEDGFTVEIFGPMGEYEIQGTSDLANSWETLTNVVLLGDSGSKVVLPDGSQGAFFVRAEPILSSYDVIFQTDGVNFDPELYCEGEDSFSVLWTWSDGTTSTEYPVASKTFDLEGARFQRLTVEPSETLTKINIGFDGADGGQLTPLEHRAPQKVSAVVFPQPLTSLQIWASSYNPITNTLDFSGFISLEYIEAYECRKLREVVVSNLPQLKRVCLEACDLKELDLSGNPNLEDVRGALNAFTNIVLGAGTGPKIWHWCVRDNPQVTQRFQDVMTNFFSLDDFWVWNSNQEGHLSFVSTNLTDVRAYRNRYTFVDFTGHSKLRVCRLYENALTNIVFTEATAVLREVDLHANQLTTEEIDRLLGEFDIFAPKLRYLDLSQNAGPASEVGLEHYRSLLGRGVTVLLDLPDDNDGLVNQPGGAQAITFVTVSANPILEIQTDGVPESIVWHWGDGTITRNVHVASHAFGSAGVYTNYVEVIPPESVTYFGAPRKAPGQGIQEVHGASNFPNLSFLYLYTESLTELSLAGCANLRQLHLASTPVSTEVCDQWFIDLDEAVAGPVAGADFWYPANRRSSVSDEAWSSLQKKGFEMRPF